MYSEPNWEAKMEIPDKDRSRRALVWNSEDGQSEFAGLRFTGDVPGHVERGFTHTESQTARFTALLGREPGKYGRYAEELTKQWTS
jgi:hypothetical protein